MTYAEAKKLADAHARIVRLEARVDVLCEYIAIIEARKRGRPSQADVERAETLKEQIHG